MNATFEDGNPVFQTMGEALFNMGVLDSFAGGASRLATSRNAVASLASWRAAMCSLPMMIAPAALRRSTATASTPARRASRASAPETIRVTAPSSAASSDATTTGSGTRTPTAPRCAVSSGFRSVTVVPRRGGLRFAFARRIARPVTVEVFRQSDGRRILGNRRIARFAGRTRSFTWSGTGVRSGAYFVRLTMKLAGGRTDVRRAALARSGGRFRARRSFYRRESCGVLESFKLGSTVFGGRQNRAMDIAFRLTRRARVSVQVLRGRRVVRTFRAQTREARITHRLRLASEGLRRGDYTIRMTVEYGGKRLTSALGARRL